METHTITTFHRIGGLCGGKGHAGGNLPTRQTKLTAGLICVRTEEMNGRVGTLLSQASPGFLVFLERIDLHPAFIDGDGLDGDPGIDQFLNKIGQ